MDFLQLIKHPVLQQKMGILRNRHTNAAELRRLLNEISILLTYEATKNLKLTPIQIETPFGLGEVVEISALPVIVSIMRAGNSMLEGVLTVLPQAEVGHIGIYRDRFSLNTVEYYLRLPNRENLQGREILLVDPLIATGDTMVASIDRLKQFKVGQISVLCVLASQLSLEKLAYFHPEIYIYTLGVEEQLNDQGYLIPGMGDIGSRLYGWKREEHEIGQ